MSGAMDEISRLVSKANDELVEAQEAFLLKFFGSFEEAQRQGHLYVLEEYPNDYVLVETNRDFLENSQALRITHKYRLRRKTQEELEADADRARTE